MWARFSISHKYTQYQFVCSFSLIFHKMPRASFDVICVCGFVLFSFSPISIVFFFFFFYIFSVHSVLLLCLLYSIYIYILYFHNGCCCCCCCSVERAISLPIFACIFHFCMWYYTLMRGARERPHVTPAHQFAMSSLFWCIIVNNHNKHFFYMYSSPTHIPAFHSLNWVVVWQTLHRSPHTCICVYISLSFS